MERSFTIDSVMNEYNDLLKSSSILQKENFYLKQEIEKLYEKEKENYLKYIEFSYMLIMMLFFSIILRFITKFIRMTIIPPRSFIFGSTINY